VLDPVRILIVQQLTSVSKWLKMNQNVFAKVTDIFLEVMIYLLFVI